jgi:hypothetical protein
MSHIIILKWLRRDSSRSTLEITLDKDLNSLTQVVPNDFIRYFSPLNGSKSVYYAEIEPHEQDLIYILKGLRSMRWNSLTSHAIIHPNHIEETRFFMEREIARPNSVNLHSNEHDQIHSSEINYAPSPFARANMVPTHLLLSAQTAGTDETKSNIKRPALSPDAIASILGKTGAPNYGFGQRPNLVNTGITLMQHKYTAHCCSYRFISIALANRIAKDSSATNNQPHSSMQAIVESASKPEQQPRSPLQQQISSSNSNTLNSTNVNNVNYSIQPVQNNAPSTKSLSSSVVGSAQRLPTQRGPSQMLRPASTSALIPAATQEFYQQNAATGSAWLLLSCN